VPDNISMVCYTESRVGTTAGREIRVEAKLPARDLSLLPQRRSVTSAGLWILLSGVPAPAGGWWGVRSRDPLYGEEQRQEIRPLCPGTLAETPSGSSLWAVAGRHLTISYTVTPSPLGQMP
jgi:hypothetical protein